MNQARAFCVALSAAITVIVASLLGLPVSSTHTAVGAIFGVGLYREAKANKTLRPAADGTLRPPQTRRLLVRRRYLLTIVAAWLVTVPCAAVLAACVFAALSLFN